MFRRAVITVLALVGAAIFAKGAYIPAKAMAAQYLLNQAWNRTAETGEMTLPWASLDAYPAARLHLPGGKSHIVLSADSGQALAFGPGLMTGTDLSGQGMIGIAAHKNTHFGKLKNLSRNDLITIEKPLKDPISFRVTDSRVIDTRTSALTRGGAGTLALVTCYPFDAVSFNGPLRYVVFAERVS